MTKLIIHDCEIVKANNLKLSINSKLAQGEKWTEFAQVVGDLEEAMKIAFAATHFEVGVFVEYSTGGFKYWSSLNPKLFNSPVLIIGNIK